MLENTFPAPSLCKLNHISVCSSRLVWRSPANSLFPSGKVIFLSDPRCFGSLGKFQHNTEISIKTARVSRLSFRLLWLCYQKGFVIGFLRSTYGRFMEFLIETHNKVFLVLEFSLSLELYRMPLAFHLVNCLSFNSYWILKIFWINLDGNVKLWVISINKKSYKNCFKVISGNQA